MNVAIRVDASPLIGTGHVMRCLTLADALKQRGAQVRFISRHMPEHLQDILIARGHELARVDSGVREAAIDGTSHAHWLDTSQRADAQDTIRVLSDQAWDWLIVDHYALDARWESALRRNANNILIIDDIAERPHDCDMLLDQNLHIDMRSRYAGRVPDDCGLLLGPHYALLRQEFRQLRGRVKPRTGVIRRVLISFGGVDAGNCTARAVEALAGLELPSLQVDVVVGAQNPFRERIGCVCAEHGFLVHVQTDRMAELMAAADLAVGAGGSASWERCCVGLPALVVSQSDSECEIATGLDRHGGCIHLGSASIAGVPAIRNAIEKLFDNRDVVAALSEHAYSLVDGLGDARVCERLRQ